MKLDNFSRWCRRGAAWELVFGHTFGQKWPFCFIHFWSMRSPGNWKWGPVPARKDAVVDGFKTASINTKYWFESSNFFGHFLKNWQHHFPDIGCTIDFQLSSCFFQLVIRETCPEPVHVNWQVQNLRFMNPNLYEFLIFSIIFSSPGSQTRSF